MENISYVWGKSGDGVWLPVWVHSYDAFVMAGVVWDYIVGEGVKSKINGVFGGEGRSVVQFLALLHDVGKVSPDFSGRESVKFRTVDLYARMREQGFSYPDLGRRVTGKAIPHASVGAFLLEEELLSSFVGTKKEKRVARELTRGVSCVVGAHHGNPVLTEVKGAGDVRHGVKTSKEWGDAQDALLSWAKEVMPGVPGLLLESLPIPAPVQVLLAGVVSMADWLASDETKMPLIPWEMTPQLGDFEALGERWNEERVLSVVFGGDNPVPREEVVVPGYRGGVFRDRTGFEMNEVQEALVEACLGVEEPDIFIVEAEMGAGKTEAALMGAEILMQRFEKSGFVFALPTMATADAIWKRTSRWLRSFQRDSGSKFSFSLIHSNARFTKKDSQGFLPEGWFSGRYRNLLNPFVVTTIDSVLLLGLKVKHAHWRHLGFASKVVIIDEVHSADAYMQSYLLTALEWLSAYGCPVIILSATLSQNDRCKILDAYKKGKQWRV